MSDTAQRYARVPAELSRAGWSRRSDHVATAGAVQGRGTSVAGALESLAVNLAAMAARVHDAPAFAWDSDNRSLRVAVPSALDNGCTHYIVHFDDNGQPTVSGCTTSDSAPAREAWKSSAAPRALPSPFYRD
jgi:hypothetical protein